MEKISTVVMLCYLAYSMALIPRTRGIVQGPEAVQEWFKNFPNAKEKLINLHFYFHDTVSGKNPTSIAVAKANITSKSPTFFGLINMMDNPLTVGPEPKSKIIGRANGIYGFASFEEVGLLMTLNLVFTEGDYKGSTLSVLGHNPILHKYRELPIVGGSGLFRLARGIATAQTTSFSGMDAVVEYNVMVLYYESK